MRAKVVVVGGGPAGVMASIIAARQGADVTLCERNDRLLRKLRISGKGRCNITNAMQPDLFLQNVQRNALFMRSSFSAFNNKNLMDFIEATGVNLKVERGKRVFPVSDVANDIAAALERELERSGVQILYNSRVRRISTTDKAVKAVELESGSIGCDSCVLATGGLSYPRTGSTGDGYGISKKQGHAVTDLYPSLAPIAAAEAWVSDIQGLSLRNVDLYAYVGKKKVFYERGELLFTSNGISGPLALSASAHLDHDKLTQSKLVIDMKPALSVQQLDARLLRTFSNNSNRMLKNSLNDILPKSIIPVAIDISGIVAEKPCNAITRAERQRMVDTLKGLTLHPEEIGPMAAAIITRGGVDVRQIDPKTMESKLVRGLFFAGEIMDIDAYTGGFNMQLAFTTGYTAGKNCAIMNATIYTDLN